jgi:hypothetical protein
VAADRRAFLRRAAGEVAAGAGRLAGLSGVAQRSAAAASAALAEGLGLSREVPEEPTVESPVAPVPAPPPTVPATVALASPALPSLSEEQHSFLLRSSSAAIAVNDARGEPQLTASWFHWDGESFRLPTGAFSAKATNIDRDAGVSLLIGDVDGGWVAVTGRASLVAGAAARGEAGGLLEKYRPGVPPDVAWSELDASHDTAIIVVTPTRFVWRMP